MRSRIVIAAAAVLALAAGGAYYGLMVYPQQQFRSGLAQVIAGLPPGVTATFRDARYSVASHRMEVTGLSLHIAGPGGGAQPIDVAFETLEMVNPNLSLGGLWTRAMANPASLTQDTSALVADDLTGTKITVHSGVNETRIDSMHVVKPRFFPWPYFQAGLPAWSDVQRALTQQPQPPDPMALLPLLRAEAVLMLSVGYESYDGGLAHITVKMPDGALSYDIGKATGHDFDRGVIGAVSADNIVLKGAKFGTASVDRVTIAASNFRQPLVALAEGAELSPGLLDGIKLGRIDYSGITGEVAGQPPVRAAGISIGPMTFAGGMPVSAAAGWTGIAVSKAQLKDPRARQVFDDMGLDKATSSFTLSYDWDVAKQQLSIHDTKLQVDELGTLVLSADLTGITPSAAGLAEAALSHAKLRLDDASLTDRLLRMGAARGGTDPAAYRQQIAALVGLQAMAGGAALAPSAKAMGDFVKSPHSLTVELAPRAPVPFASLRDAKTAAPAALLGQLGIKVTANQP